MKRMVRLKREGREAAEFRGHKLIRFFGKLTSHTRMAYCKECGMGVVVDERPAPNGIDISGEAVALTCTGKVVKEELCPCMNRDCVGLCGSRKEVSE